MKIRIKDHAAFKADRMSKVALASTPRVLLDLYCLGPGQEQRVHAHAGEDKVYLVLEGRARVTVDGATEHLAPGEAVVAPAGSPHGIANDEGNPLLVVVLVSPPPPHAS